MLLVIRIELIHRRILVRRISTQHRPIASIRERNVPMRRAAIGLRADIICVRRIELSLRIQPQHCIQTVAIRARQRPFINAKQDRRPHARSTGSDVHTHRISRGVLRRRTRAFTSVSKPNTNAVSPTAAALKRNRLICTGTLPVLSTGRTSSFSAVNPETFGRCDTQRKPLTSPEDNSTTRVSPKFRKTSVRLSGRPNVTVLACNVVVKISMATDPNIVASPRKCIGASPSPYISNRETRPHFASAKLPSP